MKRIRTVPSLFGFSIGTLLLLTIACFPKTKPSTVTTMEGEERNVRELTSLIYELTAQLSGTIETATAAMQFESDDTDIQRAALIFKSETIPALLHASFRNDPILAVADIWLLTIQLQDWVASGAGRIAFGEMQPIAIEATKKMERQIHNFLEIKETPVTEEAIRSIRERDEPGGEFRRPLGSDRDLCRDGPEAGALAGSTRLVRFRRHRTGDRGGVSGSGTSRNRIRPCGRAD
jgi:hypothetical protein